MKAYIGKSEDTCVKVHVINYLSLVAWKIENYWDVSGDCYAMYVND